LQCWLGSFALGPFQLELTTWLNRCDPAVVTLGSLVSADLSSRLNPFSDPSRIDFPIGINTQGRDFNNRRSRLYTGSLARIDPSSIGQWLIPAQSHQRCSRLSVRFAGFYGNRKMGLIINVE